MIASRAHRDDFNATDDPKSEKTRAHCILNRCARAQRVRVSDVVVSEKQSTHSVESRAEREQAMTTVKAA